MKKQKISENNESELRDFFHLVRKLLNIVDAEDFNSIIVNVSELHDTYKKNQTYMKSLEKADTPYLSASTIQQ